MLHLRTLNATTWYQQMRFILYKKSHLIILCIQFNAIFTLKIIAFYERINN